MRTESSPPRDEHPPKRQRMLACRRCRLRKQKCDEERPCTNCQRSGDECIHSEPAPRPLINPEYVKALEERIAQFEAAAEESNLPSSTVPSENHSRRSNSIGSHINPATGGRLANRTQGYTQANNTVIDTPSQASGEDFAAEYLIPGLIASPSLRSDVFNHIGPEPSLMAINTLGDISQALGSSSKPHLPQAVQNLLLNTYRERAQAQYPFLHWNTFLAWHAEWNTCPDTPQRPWQGFFINLVYSTSLLLLSWPSVDTLNARVFYGKAVALFKYVLDQASPILVAQANLLLGVHALHSSSTKRLMSLTAHTIRYCTYEQFHLAESEPLPLDTATRLANQLRRRCFWSAYCLDRMVMGALGIPPCIPDAMITARLYVNIDDENLTAVAEQTPPASELPDSTQYTCVSSPLHILQCRRIQSELAQYTLRGDYEIHYKDASDWRVRILSELESYKSRAQSFSDPQSKGHTSQRWLAMIYHYTLLMLYRPTKESVLGPAGDWSIQASSQACLIFRKCQLDRQTAQSWLGLLCQFQSGITLLYCFWATPPEYRTENYGSADASDALRACSNILAIMADRWPKADCLRDVFELLAHEVPLIDRPDHPPTHISQKSATAIKQNLPQVRTHVGHRDILRMIEEMVTEDFPRVGNPNGPSRRPASPQDERTAPCVPCTNGLSSTTSSGFELPFSTQQVYDLDGHGVDVSAFRTPDGLLAFPGVFDIDGWTYL